MGQSLVKNYIHIVFSTKHRYPFIVESVEDSLYAYIAGVCKELNCPPIKVGGFDDHVHILCMLSKTIALSTLVQKIKANSSRWMKTQSPDLASFAWQSGYGAFSVNPKNRTTVTAYIANQREHHTHKTFQKEYRQLLNQYHVEYNEEYVWD